MSGISDLDPAARKAAALEVARRNTACSGAGNVYCTTYNPRCQCREQSDAAIIAYLTAREPGVTGKGEGEK